MKVAVTGASGFVGRHVVSALLARGADVVAVARTSHNVLPRREKLTTVSLDISEPGDAFLRLGKPDAVLHLAWGGLPNFRSRTHIEVELPRQIAFLSELARAGLRRLVVTGTCLEYGMQSGCLDESLETSPVTAYGEAKDRLHSFLQELANSGGPELTWARLFYLYGPGQAASSLYSQLRAAVAAGAGEFPMSPGDQQRDFLSIEAAADLLSALTLKSHGAGTVNVCSGSPRTVTSLTLDWLRDWNARVALKPGAFPYPDYEPKSFWGSTRKLAALLETK